MLAKSSTLAVAALLLALPAAAGSPAPATSDGLKAHIEILASDAFQGRKPGTVGEEKTLDYITGQFRKLGLKPLAGGSFLQDVPLTEVTVTADGPLTAKTGGKDLSFKVGDDTILWTRRRQDPPALTDSPVVFVGYGITAPRYDWDDYAGVDVRGKTVMVLINDPGFATGDPALFEGRTMTYEGRWTYKFEEAARHGAAGVLIVHETEAAGYPWSVVRTSNSVPKLHLTDPDGRRSTIEGWVQRPVAEQMLAAAGLDYAALKDAAARRGFKPVELPLTVSARIKAGFRDLVSHNVVGLVPGKKRPDEVVIYSAHWDHLGVGLPDKQGRTIYHGAIDNASGVAGLIELARRYRQGPAPDRTVAFISFTAEEQGLLGSEYYATHPVFPTAKTVAGFNMDSLGVIGRVRDVVAVGMGKNSLEEDLKAWAVQHDMQVNPETFPERGTWFRSDHFPLAKVGIPVIYAKAGVDSVAHGRDWGKEQADRFTKEDYHQPSDLYSPAMDLSGGAQEVNMLYDLGHLYAFSARWPHWYDGVPFKAARDGK